MAEHSARGADILEADALEIDIVVLEMLKQRVGFGTRGKDISRNAVLTSVETMANSDESGMFQRNVLLNTSLQ